MLITTDQMSRVHKLEKKSPRDKRKWRSIRKSLSTYIWHVNSGKPQMNQIKHVTKTVSLCFAALLAIKKIRNMVLNAFKKQLVEALVLSKVDYNDIVFYPQLHYFEAKLQRVQKSPASFVNNRYSKMADVIELGWLPVKERPEMHLLTTTHRALHDTHWPSYLTLQRYQIAMYLRSCATQQLVVRFETGIFKDLASRLYNNLRWTPPQDFRYAWIDRLEIWIEY